MASRSWRLGQCHTLMYRLIVVVVTGILLGLQPVSAQDHPAGLVLATDANGQSVLVSDNRQPALYTQTFGDCLGGSLIDVTRFDAAYYQDNMTVTFHLQGTAQITNMSLMLYFGVYAYGESRFEKVFDPCGANIISLCPTNISMPVEASGLIPVAQSDVAGIPPIALTIPDFEGQAVLRIFSNATDSEIACFSAVITNGATLSQQASVGTILGVITLLAVIASAASALYGQQLTNIRNHYAHSLSVFVIFAVYQHIYYLGALSMTWPSVLPAWWSNFAWAAGMIYTPSMQSSFNSFLSENLGNTSVVGAAPLGASDNTAGGYQISQIYKRTVDAATHFARPPLRFRALLDAYNARQDLPQHSLAPRSLINSTTGFVWYGHPVGLGLPLPGNYSGFAGTLSAEGIPASTAFLTGLVWTLIAILVTVGSLALLKWILEGCIRKGWARADRLTLFRQHWLAVIAMATARILFITFFMLIFLALFQFVYRGPPGVIVLAVLTFVVVLVVMAGVVGLSCFYRLRYGSYSIQHDRLYVEGWWKWHVIPCIEISRGTTRDQTQQQQRRRALFSIPWRNVIYTNEDPARVEVFNDEHYLMRYGWLVGRFRKSRWWFASLWLVYEFIRACFYGGAASSPSAQVFGLLAVEIIAFLIMIRLRPFEGNRVNVLMIYLLGLSKVLTVALSCAFHPQFGLPRIIATGIGFVIIVIQGLMVLVLVILMILGMISTYFSITRNRQEFHPEKLRPLRERYLAHIETAATDQPTQQMSSNPGQETSKSASTEFNVLSSRRIPKIDESENPEAGDFDPFGSRLSVLEDPTSPPAPPRAFSQASRTASMMSSLSHSNLPYGARPHRASWSSRDLSRFQEGYRNSSAISSTSLASPSVGPHRNLSAAGDAAASNVPSPGASRSPSVALEGRRTRPWSRSGTNPTHSVVAERTSEEGSDAAGGTAVKTSPKDVSKAADVKDGEAGTLPTAQAVKETPP